MFNKEIFYIGATRGLTLSSAKPVRVQASEPAIRRAPVARRTVNQVGNAFASAASWLAGLAVEPDPRQCRTCG